MDDHTFRHMEAGFPDVQHSILKPTFSPAPASKASLGSGENRPMRILPGLLVFASVLPLQAAVPWLALAPQAEGPASGKHIVLISGDDEYRSEEALPQLAKILTRLGARCTVLFPINPADGTIDPSIKDNIPGLEALKQADLAVLGLRFRDLPDNQMRHFVDYLDAAKPIVALRTSTHAFNIKPGKTYAKYSYNSKDPSYPGGFGKQILGETWVAHHGKHGVEGTRGILNKDQLQHPILQGIRDGDIFGTTDVYTVHTPLPGDSTPLVYGQVTQTLDPNSPPVEGKKNDPMMPVAWTKTYIGSSGQKGRVFVTTLGASSDLAWEGTRRLIVNGCLWAMGLDQQIPTKTNVDIVGRFEPSPFKMNGHKRGVRPEDLRDP